jgi:predicted PhzF superfamily epimerase YddE/YHI9
MPSLAAELGIAETAFVLPAAAPDSFDQRWFSPLVEVDLWGHATLASAHALRVFGPKVGIDEDPATGSAQSAVGPYCSAVLGRPTSVGAL